MNASKPEPWLTFPHKYASVLQALSEDLENANGRLQAGLQDYPWWSHVESAFHSQDRDRVFQKCMVSWMQWVADDITERFPQLLALGAQPQEASDMVRSVLKLYACVADVLRSVDRFLFTEDVLPPGVCGSDWYSVEFVANPLEQTIFSYLEQLTRNAQIQADISTTRQQTDKLQLLPSVIDGERAFRYDQELRKMQHASRGRYLSEQALREQFPAFEIWKVIDSSESLPPSHKKEYFATGLHGRHDIERHAFIGDIMDAEASTVQGWLKKYRHAGGIKRKRRRTRTT